MNIENVFNRKCKMSEQRQYRGWSIQENKWVYGWYFLDGTGKHFIVSDGDIHSMENYACDAMSGFNASAFTNVAIENMPDFIEVEPDSVGQYIGVEGYIQDKSKNGQQGEEVNIYVGDIIIYTVFGPNDEHEFMKGEVGFVDFRYLLKLPEDYRMNFYDFDTIPDNILVVGNAWEEKCQTM